MNKVMVNVPELENTLVAFIEEWGRSSVSVQLPMQWLAEAETVRFDDYPLFSFTTENQIIITVSQGTRIEIQYQVEI